ncbi:MAG: hypothetical protein ABI668_13380 [Sphingorhabdus sp.]
MRQKLGKKVHSERAWTTATAIYLAPLIFIAPPLWFGYAAYGVTSVMGFGLLATIFAFFLARSDGMKLRLSKRGIKVLAITYMQITGVFLVLFVFGHAAAN